MDKIIVFTTGAVGYTLLELLWRGYSHWTMTLTGGLCLLLIYIMNTASHAPFFIKCLMGAAIITSAELIVGFIVNITLHWQVWDYSSLPLNFKGQICLPYSAMWFLLCIPLMKLCDLLRGIQFT